MKKDFPIIEFDPESNNMIIAKSNVNTSISLPEQCVITFFGDAVRSMLKEKKHVCVGSLMMETFEIPLYIFHDENNNDVVVLHGLGSGPYAAGQIEKLVSLGCKRFVVCGGCGVLESNTTVGEIFIPIAAVRDEGTSYHYIKPSREVKMNSTVVEKMCSYLDYNNIPYRCVKTWTTDAMYRETVNMVSLRKEEGCQVVEMECAAYLAVAQYKNVALGQLLYAGDDLSNNKWSSREWKNATSIRKFLLELAINLCNQIHV